MSFILDALKKSEGERQRKSTPGVADIPDARVEPHTPRWLWVVGALLAINLTVLVVVLLRHGAEPSEAKSIAQTIERTDARTDDTPEREAQKSFSDIVAEAKENHRQAEPPPASTPESESATRRTAVTTSPEPTKAGTIGTSLSTLNELRADGTLQLPELHLDLHVYSDEPADRFVMINMSKYEEGATLTEGPQVKEITPLGVILEHQGTEFLLPRE